MDLLLQWNRTINLIAREEEARVWQRHVGDSLQIVPLIDARVGSAADIGSGGGFPGLVLALHTGIRWDLIESDGRKAAFLREAARLTGAPVQVHATRAERLNLRPVPLITARGVAPLPRLLELAVPLLTPSGTCLFLKGRSAGAELADASREWRMQVRRVPSRTAPDGAILSINEIRRTSDV